MSHANPPLRRTVTGADDDASMSQISQTPNNAIPYTHQRSAVSAGCRSITLSLCIADFDSLRFSWWLCRSIAFAYLCLPYVQRRYPIYLGSINNGTFMHIGPRLM